VARQLHWSMRKAPKADSEKRALKDEPKQVKRDLRRKEKALAETAALLVLKKKRWSIGAAARTARRVNLS